MATCDDASSCTPVPDPFLCWFWHRWSKWGNPIKTSGFNLAWQLVPCTVQYRSCKRCHRVQDRQL